ncbi:MAG: carbon storage regulator CsrA [Verrucomicrobia bacterium]|jgi:carbon storage regulator|nr:MAG: carbon storage regulator CsrA [Verrucomicrobiota bacterium]
MLILSRKINESIVIDGRITVKIVRVEGDVVKLGVEAPPDVPVHRQEIYDEIQRNNKQALTQGRPVLPRLPESKPRKNFIGQQVAGTTA